MRTFKLYAFPKEGSGPVLRDEAGMLPQFTARTHARAIAKAHDWVRTVQVCCWELYEVSADGGGHPVLITDCRRPGGHGKAEGS